MHGPPNVAHPNHPTAKQSRWCNVDRIRQTVKILHALVLRCHKAACPTNLPGPIVFTSLRSNARLISRFNRVLGRHTCTLCLTSAYNDNTFRRPTTTQPLLAILPQHILPLILHLPLQRFDLVGYGGRQSISTFSHIILSPDSTYLDVRTLSSTSSDRAHF
jgi:hypothetical protein